MGRGRLYTYFSNSVRVVVSAASTSAQLPWGQVTFVPGLSLLPRQYAAAEYWEKNWSLLKTSVETAVGRQFMVLV